MSKQPNYVFDDETELYHHGIPGQRWNRRRFQYEDGSWTPEGRERYGKGGLKEKTDVQKYRAKVTYDTQKYKENLKAKAAKEKDKRLYSIERNRIKQNSKNMMLARKEQAKFDRLNKREEDKIKRIDYNKSVVVPKNGKTKYMSNDDLRASIERLKLQSEYAKQYALASSPNSALAKADRFFSGPTGQVVKDVAVATIPKLAETAASKIIESNLKYANSLDRQSKQIENMQNKANVRKQEIENKKTEMTNELMYKINQADANRQIREIESKTIVPEKKPMFKKNNSAPKESNKITFSEKDFIKKKKKK